MIYLDSCYLVRLYFEDPGFGPVRELAASDHVACAEHGRAEVIAAFHRKLREGTLRTAEYRGLLAQFQADDAAGAVEWLPLAVEVQDRIGQVYAELPASVYLRAADALHLAAAAAHGHRLVYSNDLRFLEAAPHFGLKGRNVIVA